MAETVTAEKLAKILERVRMFLAKAESTNYPEEADTFRSRADALMFKYRIDIAQAEDRAESRVLPSWRTINLGPALQEFSPYYRMLAGIVVRHFDCEAVTSREWDMALNDYASVLHVVGYEAELQFVDLLLTDCLAAFGRYLEPGVDKSVSPEVNALRMRKAGMERHRIARLLLGGWDTENEMKAKTRKVTRMIREAAAATGENVDDLLGRGNNIKTYRETFAESFYSTLSSRLWRMAQGRSQEGTIVLASRKEQVKSELYKRYPHLKPNLDAKPIGAGYVPPNETCEKCKKAKSGYCREHGYLKPSTAKPQELRWSQAGYERGAAAARSVDLGTAGKQELGN